MERARAQMRIQKLSDSHASDLKKFKKSNGLKA